MENAKNPPVKPVPERTFTMNIWGEGPPAVIGKIVGKLAWRRDVLPAIKLIAADVAGHPVKWEEINVFEGPGATDEEALANWAKWEARDVKPFPMYIIDAPKTFRKIS